jgi:hypothetical protein
MLVVALPYVRPSFLATMQYLQASCMRNIASKKHYKTSWKPCDIPYVRRSFLATMQYLQASCLRNIA